MNPNVVTLSNGARIIHAPNPGLKTFGIVAGINVGSRRETKAVNGISHLLEHLLFKGSSLYKTAKDIARALDDKGGYHNAFTSEETTGIQARIASEYEVTAASVVMDVLGNALLRPKDIEREKPVVCDEIRMYDADDRDRTHVLNMKLLYGDDPLGWPIAGTTKKVSAMTPAVIKSFYRKHYVPESIVVALSGKYTEKASQIVENSLLALSSQPKEMSTPRGLIEPPLFSGTIVSTSITPRAYIRISFAGPDPAARREATAFKLMSLALGGYSSARLFDVLREKNSLCYYVGAGYDKFSDATSVYIGMELEPKNLSKSLDLLGKELTKLTRRGITGVELESAKSCIRGSTAMLRDSALDTAEHHVLDLLLRGEVESVPSMLSRYNDITLAEVQDVAAKYMVCAQTTILAPEKHHSAIRRDAEKHIETVA